MLKCLKKEIRSLDMFGKKVSLRFNKEGKTFRTPYGVLASIMIYLIVGLISTWKFITLIKKYGS